ncbi:MAG TPA: cupin domain-containing protein [Candidatus Sulfotelmatobacter sp.]|nr:cupin domain-containing protein [Candidatus Sulfotelmatobacter sp.]
MTTFHSIRDLRPLAIREGINARAVNGERITMAVVDLDPGATLPEHHHENEQLGIVIAGAITMRIGGERRELHAGDTYTIPSHVPHDALAGPAGCTLADVFAPVRADWDKLERLEPSRPRWP